MSIIKRVFDHNTFPADDIEPWQKEGVKHPGAVRALLIEFTYLESMNESYAENGLSDDELEEALYEIFRRITELAGGVQWCTGKMRCPKSIMRSFNIGLRRSDAPAHGSVKLAKELGSMRGIGWPSL
ncbi:hypothetical protein [Serratia liquefaciens]|uniref:hypothetical protein n=1 Tax=Serratia liquefaciens TaxID=614 RepID=UPI00301D5C34